MADFLCGSRSYGWPGGGGHGRAGVVPITPRESGEIGRPGVCGTQANGYIALDFPGG